MTTAHHHLLTAVRLPGSQLILSLREGNGILTRVLIGVGIAVGLALCATVVFLAVIGFSRYRTNLEAAVSEATGRDLRIAGNFQP